MLPSPQYLRILFLCCACCLSNATIAQQVQEVRGVWLTNVDSDVLHSWENIASAIDYLADTGFNVVFPVVWNKGYTLFPSATMDSLFGLPQDPFFAEAGRDPLQEVIIEAHRRGLEVIPWFEFGFSTSYSLNGGHIIAAKPDWAAMDVNGNLLVKNGFDWMNAFHPEVQDFMLALVREVAEGYDVDGIQGDDRLPALPVESGYSPYTIQLYQDEHGGQDPPSNPKDNAFKRWKANKITAFARRLYDEVKAIDPNLTLSAAPSIYPFAYDEYLQDWPAWMEAGIVDILHPQAYRRELNEYKSLINRMAGPGAFASDYEDRIFPGILLKIGSFFNSPANMVEAVRYNRGQGLNGEVFFFYEGLREKNQYVADSLFRYRYAEPARMPGRRGIHRPPALILHETAAEVTVEGTWTEDPFANGFEGNILISSEPGATISYDFTPSVEAVYNVYAYIPFLADASSNSQYVVSFDNQTTTAEISQMITQPSKWIHLGQGKASSTIKVSLTTGNNGPSENTVADAIMVMLNRKKSPEAFFPVSTNSIQQDPLVDTRQSNIEAPYPNPFHTSAWIPVEINHPGIVRLELFDLLGRRLESIIDQRYMVPGTYQVPIDRGNKASGVYFLVLTTTEAASHRPITVR